MWILPKNYQLSSRFAQDMVASKEDLSLPDLNIESSLMWRSKPSALRVWLTRWKTGSYLPHLYGRILKPCQWNAFETELTSSLAVTHVSHFRQQESDLAKMTQDTSGLTSKKSSEQFDLFDASSKMLKDTLALGSEKSLATWKALVIARRGGYSVRVKSALLTRESESISWPTPRASEHKDCGPVGSKSQIHMDKRSYLCAKVKDPNMPLGMLNPDWVEWLMGVPTGWTGLGSWGTE
jgi:hypothetical protein